MRQLWMGLLLSCLLIACGDSNPKEGQTDNPINEPTEFTLSDQAKSLYEIVGEKHDTAMLLMKNIEQVKSALRLEMKTLEKEAASKDIILDLLTALKKADDGMMDWMHEFKSTELDEEMYKAMSEEEIMAYLKQEEVKIEQVHLDMINSIANGKVFLSTVNK